MSMSGFVSAGAIHEISFCGDWNLFSTRFVEPDFQSIERINGWDLDANTLIFNRGSGSV